MFCPECQAEYREGISTCADCGVPLVEMEAALPAEQGETFSARPMAAVWRGHDKRKAERVQEGLLRVGLPAEMLRQESSAYEVRVPVWTANEVADVIARALSPNPPGPALPIAGGEAPLLECPLCWADYALPVEFCPNCAVPLADLEREDPSVKIWEGDHPGDAYQIHQAMMAAGIPFHVTGVMPRISHVLVPRSPLQGHRYSLKVLARDEAVARSLVDSLPLTNATKLDVLPPDEQPAPDAFSREEEPDIEWVLVWSGTNIEALEALRYAFRENEIPMQVEGDEAQARRQLRVPVDCEARAREIIRQILEGEVPPEIDLSEVPS